MRLWLKLALVAGMTLAILVPLMLIRAVIHERQQYRAEAVTSVAATVGGAQTSAGPVLRIPYTFMAESQVENKDGSVRTVRERTGSTLVVFPETLTAQGVMKPETRRRGLHEVRVFEWQGEVAATFNVELLSSSDPAADIQIGTPVLVYGISDVRGVRGTPVLRVGGQDVALQQLFARATLARADGRAGDVEKLVLQVPGIGAVAITAHPLAPPLLTGEAALLVFAQPVAAANPARLEHAVQQLFGLTDAEYQNLADFLLWSNTINAQGWTPNDAG